MNKSLTAVSITSNKHTENLRAEGKFCDVIALSRVFEMQVRLHRSGTQRKNWQQFKSSNRYADQPVDVMLVPR